jgi:hypothetical protein
MRFLQMDQLRLRGSGLFGREKKLRGRKKKLCGYEWRRRNKPHVRKAAVWKQEEALGIYRAEQEARVLKKKEINEAERIQTENDKAE